MAIRHDPSQRQADTLLHEDFSARLEGALQRADAERRRRVLRVRLAKSASVALLVGPILAWRLIGTTPGGEHVVVDALVWMTFLLDIGVHIDNATLSYLHLQAIPVIVGLLLLVVIGIWLLGGTERTE